MIKIPYRVLIVFLIVLYIIFFSSVNIISYITFSYNDFDLAVHAQTLWNIVHGSIQSSILGIAFLGNHLNLILFLIAPIYKLFPHPVTLLILQTLFLGIGALPLSLIAREKLGKPFDLMFVIIYFMYPPLGFVNLFEFHPIALTIPMLFAAFYSFEKNRFKSFLMWMFFAMLCKENVALIMFFYGIYAVFRRRSFKWIFVPIFIGGLWFFTYAAIILPYFNKGLIGFYNLYSHLGQNVLEILAAILKKPWYVLKIMMMPHNRSYILNLIGPVGIFIPLLAIDKLFIILPIILQHTLSIRATEQTINYHYTAPMIPFILISAVYGLKKILDKTKSRIVKKTIVLMLIVTAFSWSVKMGVFVDLFFKIPRLLQDDLDIQRHQMVKLIPQDASCIATFQFLSHLTNRRRLYSFHNIYHGFYTLSYKEYVLPEKVEYTLIDFNDPLTFGVFWTPSGARNIREFMKKDKWGVVEVADSLVLLKSNYKSDKKLYESQYSCGMQFNGIKIEGNDEHIELVDVNMNFDWEERRLLIWSLWHAKAEERIEAWYWKTIEIIEENSGSVLHKLSLPICYGVYPTNEWAQGEFVKENNWIKLREGVDYDTCLVRLKLYAPAATVPAEPVLIFESKI